MKVGVCKDGMLKMVCDNDVCGKIVRDKMMCQKDVCVCVK